MDGSVTVPSGAFSSSMFDQGFAIQDHTGGIYVSTPDNLGFAPRQQVRVTGTLADTVQPGLLVLTNVTDTKAHGSGPKVQPLPVATGAVGEAAAILHRAKSNRNSDAFTRVSNLKEHLLAQASFKYTP